MSTATTVYQTTLNVKNIIKHREQYNTLVQLLHFWSLVLDG